MKYFIYQCHFLVHCLPHLKRRVGIKKGIRPIQNSTVYNHVNLDLRFMSPIIFRGKEKEAAAIIPTAVSHLHKQQTSILHSHSNHEN